MYTYIYLHILIYIKIYIYAFMSIHIFSNFVITNYQSSKRCVCTFMNMLFFLYVSANTYSHVFIYLYIGFHTVWMYLNMHIYIMIDNIYAYVYLFTYVRKYKSETLCVTRIRYRGRFCNPHVVNVVNLLTKHHHYIYIYRILLKISQFLGS
jgi:hypothetical protein